ncbi:MAG: hypothetical protein LKJ90_03655 [Faecalibacterium sp.]|jgi:hypothetical protein|nr:hypothetical protein [Faecalibacterium sp.]
MKREQRTGFAFFLQILLLLFLFLGVCAVLMQAFAGAAALSRRAKQTNDGTEICRSAAEAFSADGTVAGTLSILGGTDFAEVSGDTTLLSYDDTLCPAQGGCYTLTIRTEQQVTAAGALQTAHFAVQNAAGETCAALDTEKYLPEGGSADAA